MPVRFGLIWPNGFRRFLQDFVVVEFRLIRIFEKINKTIFHRKKPAIYNIIKE